MHTEPRFIVRYCERGKWMTYGTPFATLRGAIACLVRLQNAGLRAQTYQI